MSIFAVNITRGYLLSLCSEDNLPVLLNGLAKIFLITSEGSLTGSLSIAEIFITSLISSLIYCSYIYLKDRFPQIMHYVFQYSLVVISAKLRHHPIDNLYALNSAMIVIICHPVDT